MNPTPPLPPASNLSTQPKTKRPQHFFDCAAMFTQHYAESQIHHSNAGDPDMCSRLPLPANIGQESRARRTVLSQNVIAPIPVISNRRSANKISRRLFSLRNRPSQISRTNHPALANAPLLLRRPSSGDVFSRQMNDRIESRNQR